MKVKVKIKIKAETHMQITNDPCIYTFDGSFEGFLAVVFRAFDDKRMPEAIVSRAAQAQLPLGEMVHVETCNDQAARVRSGIAERSDEKNLRLFHVAFLAESPETNLLLWRYLQKLFHDNRGEYYRNMLDEEVYSLIQTARQVRREAHRFQGFVRFQRTRDEMYVAAIDPDHDVVKLLSAHFRARFSDRHWLIYDTRRNYGIYYDLESVREVRMDTPALTSIRDIFKNRPAPWMKITTGPSGNIITMPSILPKGKTTGRCGEACPAVLEVPAGEEVRSSRSTWAAEIIV